MDRPHWFLEREVFENRQVPPTMRPAFLQEQRVFQLTYRLLATEDVVAQLLQGVDARHWALHPCLIKHLKQICIPYI